MIIDNLHEHLCELADRQLFFVVDGAVRQKCFELSPCIMPENTYILEAQESNKTLQAIQKIWDFLLEKQATRNSVLVNIGGGIVCDIGGFCASTYMRGMAYINVPTTLLAMVDAANGGKTGFNYKGIKNCVGVIQMPLQVWHYIPFLETLPRQELLSGWAEMLKHALLFSANEWERVTHAMQNLTNLDKYTFASLVEQSCWIKERYVQDDVADNGMRKALNFGHTVGHAVEEWQLSLGKTIPHGFAVMYGMVAELFLSVEKKHFPQTIFEQLKEVWQTYYKTLPITPADYETIIAWTHKDKKNTQTDQINCTLLADFSRPYVNQIVSEKELKLAMENW